MDTQISGKTATSIGFASIVMWGTMPALATFLGHVPPFLINSLAFSVAFLVTLLKWKVENKDNFKSVVKEHLTLRPRIWALGLFGIFGFHTFYFLAYRHAEPLAVVIMVNLWPLMTILFSGLLLGYAIKQNHLIGAILGLAGVAFIALRNGFAGLGLSPLQLQGYFEAFMCAFSWSLYSVLSKKWADEMKPDSVGVFCGITALLSIFCHLFFEDSSALTLNQFLLISVMGLFPMGVAFFTWDYGMKHGNIRTLGLLSYCGPLIGIALLILLGLAEYSNEIVIAAGLIVAGALVGTFERSKFRAGEV